jgi:trigger factor
MQVQVARISPVVIELAVEVPADAVKVEVDKAYATLQKKARVRGFRPGKAPRQVLAQLYGPQVANDVANAIVNGTLPKALSDHNVQPVNQPQVEAGRVEGGAAFSYKARFEVSPDIAEVTYEGLELLKPPAAATDTMVDEQIEMLRKTHSAL